jgi:uncharacterized protein (DUF433 family)
MNVREEQALTLPPTEYPHITRDQNGVLHIDGTGFKPVLLLEGYLSWGVSDQEFLEAFPTLTQAQFHAMLAYYFDHQAEIDEEIQRGHAEAERILAEAEAASPEHYARVRAKLERYRREHTHPPVERGATIA